MRTSAVSVANLLLAMVITQSLLSILVDAAILATVMLS
jgi:hypothetical protein